MISDAFRESKKKKSNLSCISSYFNGSIDKISYLSFAEDF